MLKKNALQFSVVREDPQVELELFHQFNIKKPIFIGSGGCTAFAIASKYPQIPLTLIEPNLAQIKLIKEKIKILKSSSHKQLKMRFGIGLHEGNKHSLIEQGNFESLFRELRNFINEFIIEKNLLEKLFLRGTNREWKQVFAHPYWPVGFNLFFNQTLLLTMFGPAAVQHAPPKSYGSYFRSIIEKGLLSSDRSNNYFLHHILFGHYPKAKKGWPLFLQKPPTIVKIKFYSCLAQKVEYSPYDFVGLSNIFDWSSESEIKKVTLKLNNELKSGAIVLFRQLNNAKDFRKFFGERFEWLSEEAHHLHQKDRSLFYSSIQIARAAL